MKSLLDEYAAILRGFDGQEASLSVSGLASLAHAGIALHNLVVLQSLDAVYGNRTEYLLRLKHLYSVCRKRYMAEQDFSARCQLAHTLQLLANEPSACCIPWTEKCSALCGKFIARELAMHRDCTLPYWLWCIAYGNYPLSEATSAGEDFLCFKNHLEGWIHDLQGKDWWPGLSPLEALWRIDLLNANSYLFLEDVYDENIRALYIHYRGLVPIGPTADRESLLAMGLLYRQALNFYAYPVDWATKQAVVQALKDSFGRLAESSDEWLYVFAFLVSDLCETLASES